MQKDYSYVVKAGEKIFNKIPEDRQAHFARIMSESYLVLGDKDKARSYYQKNLEEKVDRTRSDYFYAGSVLYGVEDWQGAVDSFSQMEERTDSLGQIANYQMGYSYIQLRNKVAALDAFKEAAALSWNKDIQEDAYFNYAKLAFDLNNDVSAFNDYMKRYDALSKGDQIYSYMAMAALMNHDYEAAVAAYDNIEELDPRMQSNYMKAYFLRANQLIENGSWRDAVPRLRTAAYYSPRQDPFNQLSRYWMAESYFRDEKYDEARNTLTDLYNLSALNGKKEGDLIPYNIAYTYFKEGDYPNAQKWFDRYLEGRHDAFGSDAETRIGDCHFFQKDYASAIAAFERKLADYPDANDIYPYFRAGVACGLINDFPRKVKFLERVKQASPSSPYYSEAMYELGRAYVSVGEKDNAVKAFQTLRGSTDDPAFATRALLELGMIARNGGDDAQALEYSTVPARNPTPTSPSWRAWATRLPGPTPRRRMSISARLRKSSSAATMPRRKPLSGTIWRSIRTAPRRPRPSSISASATGVSATRRRPLTITPRLLTAAWPVPSRRRPISAPATSLIPCSVMPMLTRLTISCLRWLSWTTTSPPRTRA